MRTVYEVDQVVRHQGLIELTDRDELGDDPDRIVQYRVVGLAGGLQQGTPDEVLWAWQWLSDHPDLTNRLEEWFSRRVAELKEMGRIK